MSDKSAPWLHVVGIGEDGIAGLSPAARAVLESAEVIVGGDRHHRLSDRVSAQRIAWPSPFDAVIHLLEAHRGRRIVVLATGDPLWFSVGARIVRALGEDAVTFHPQLSAFQLAAARLGWSMADVETLTVHGRPVEQMIPFIQPGARLLILTTGADTPGRIAGFLTDRGYGDSRMIVLSAMGGADEARTEAVARSWSGEVPAFNTLAVECVAGPGAEVLSRVPGLADDAFAHDGKITKQEVRALTLARLMPMRGALLWDIGAGCGSIGIEWMRAAPDARAIGLEPQADRRALAAANAARLGTPRFELRDAAAPDGLAGLPAPDAVFIGGGLSQAVADGALAALRPFGRLVANAVTLESEAVLLALHARLGGDLTRIAVARAAPVGGLTGWRPLMPVTQWALVKR
jgi:precorrin-6Y C5,15-methyltransferase (decarboxylating)